MKKIFYSTLVLTLTSPNLVSAATNPFSGASTNLNAVTGVVGPGGKTNVPLILGYLMQATFGVLGIVALAYIVYAGYIRLIATEPDDVKKSNKTMIYLAIGLIILLSALAISQFVFNQFFNPIAGLPSQ